MAVHFHADSAFLLHRTAGEAESELSYYRSSTFPLCCSLITRLSSPSNSSPGWRDPCAKRRIFKSMAFGRFAHLPIRMNWRTPRRCRPFFYFARWLLLQNGYHCCHPFSQFLFSLPSHRNKNVLDVLRWLTNYDDLYSARCVICHSQMSPSEWDYECRPLTGSDAFCVPSLRHFDTGAPYHPSCCMGETLLRTW